MKTNNQDSPPLLQKKKKNHNFIFCSNLNFININLTSKVIDFPHTMSPNRKIFYWYFLIITSSLELKVNGALVRLNFYYWKTFLPLSKTERFPSTYTEFAERPLTWGFNPEHALCCSPYKRTELVTVFGGNKYIMHDDPWMIWSVCCKICPKYFSFSQFCTACSVLVNHCHPSIYPRGGSLPISVASGYDFFFMVIYVERKAIEMRIPWIFQHFELLRINHSPLQRCHC